MKLKILISGWGIMLLKLSIRYFSDIWLAENSILFTHLAKFTVEDKVKKWTKAKNNFINIVFWPHMVKSINLLFEKVWNNQNN